MQAETRYAKSDDVHIAYQVIGGGPIDLLYVPGWISHLEEAWDDPNIARFLQRLASFSRLIRFDKRGTGMSDRVPDSDLPTPEQRMDDVRAVLDAVGSDRVALLGASDGGPICVLFAATYPHRTSALLLYGSHARRLWAPDYPWGPTIEQRQALHEAIERDWGKPEFFKVFNPVIARDEHLSRLRARQLRRSASPGAALALARMNVQIDVRDILPAVHVPTLVLTRSDDPQAPLGGSQFMASRIPGARLVELPGHDHLPWIGDDEAVADEIEEFLTGARPSGEPERVLATLLITDIIEPMARAATLGDWRWRELLEAYYDASRRELARFRGREVKTVGHGILATFDGAARAVRCAHSINDAVQQLGIQIRTGLHTGEVEILGDDLGGMTVQVCARIAAEAGASELLVSSIVRDLVADSGLEFDDRGTRVFRGAPGEWRLFGLRSARQTHTAAVERSPGGGTASSPSRTFPLTRRQCEVAILVGRGYSNRRIAEALVIAEKTAEVHARNVRERLGLESRAQIAAWVVQHGLLSPTSDPSPAP